MLLYILGGVWLCVIGFTLSQNIRNDGYETGTVINTIIISILSLLILSLVFGMACGVQSASKDGEAFVDKVETYAIVENSNISIHNGTVDFVTEENGSLKPLSLYSADTKFIGKERKTVEVTYTRYEQGTSFAPWGLSGTETTIVVR